MTANHNSPPGMTSFDAPPLVAGWMTAAPASLVWALPIVGHPVFWRLKFSAFAEAFIANLAFPGISRRAFWIVISISRYSCSYTISIVDIFHLFGEFIPKQVVCDRSIVRSQLSVSRIQGRPNHFSSPMRDFHVTICDQRKRVKRKFQGIL